jgi:hypothetical protein
MYVAAGIDVQAGYPCCCEIGRHHRCRPAQEAEGRGEHAREADGHKFPGTVNVLPFEDGDGVGAIRSRCEPSVGRARHLLAQCFARKLSSIDGVSTGGGR